MNRVFLSLYFLIVFSVVVVGWGADRLWQVYNPEPETLPSEVALFRLVENSLVNLNFEQAEKKCDELSQVMGYSLDVYHLRELSKTSLSKQIESGKIVTVYESEKSKSSYKRVLGADYVLRLRLAHAGAPQGQLYIALLVAFYLIIAIIIYFWVWPLARDLNKLQAYTKKVGFDSNERVDLGQQSTVYSLAAAFNLMSERINNLLASHREITYAVSHELRTPIARMKFALEMAKDSDKVDVKKRQLDSIQEDITEMDTLINELLAYAGFEQKNQELDFKSGDLNAMLENLLNSNQAAMTAKNISFHLVNKLDDSEVFCEWYLIERCFHNVIQNAFKYAQSKIVVNLSIESGFYCVSIEDDGQGIEEQDRRKVLQAFVRLRLDPEDKSGFGLGLAIVNRIMKWHRGGVRIDDSALGGAKFVLFWPVPKVN